MAADRWWNTRRTKAAQMVADDELSDELIAKTLGRSRMWLHNLKHDDRFSVRVRFIVEQQRAAISEKGIADRRNRTDEALERHAALKARKSVLLRIISERAEAPINQGVAGGTTGYLAHSVKAIGKGGVDVWEFDSALASELRAIDVEMRAIERQLAQDLGQWTEKRELTGKGGGPVRLLWDDGEEV